MKKILFLLLLTTASYGQALFDKGVKITGGITTDNTAPNVVVKSSNNVLNTIAKNDLIDVVIVNTTAELTAGIGNISKLYATRDNTIIYRFNGSIYVPLGGSITSTATTNFIPKVNAGGNLENSNLLDDGSFIRSSTDIIVNGVRFGLGTGNIEGNIVIGGSNFDSGITGRDNVALGGFSLFSNRASRNLGIGTESLIYNVEGSDIIGIGYQAGTMNSDNSNNTRSDNSLFIGSRTKPLGSNQTNQIVIGNQSVGLGSNTTVIGNNNTLFGRWHGDLLVGTNTRDGINAAIINGTVKASPAVTNDQVPTLGQVIQTTGNQSKTGTLIFTNTLGAGASSILLNNSGSFGGVFQNTGEGKALQVNQSGVGGTGIGGGASTGTFSNVQLTGDAQGFSVNSLDTTTGNAFQSGFNNSINYSVNRLGQVSASPATTNTQLPTLGQIKSRDGWASYSTTTYTNASPFVVSPNTTVTLPNNANNSITSDLPLGVTAFYNGTTNKITPAAIGDAYTVNVRFKARTTMNNDYLTLFIDIGNGTQINAEAKQFLKGANTEQPFSFTMPIFTLATFVANGGLIKVASNGGTISIYDITYYINRNYTR